MTGGTNAAAMIFIADSAISTVTDILASLSPSVTWTRLPAFVTLRERTKKQLNEISWQIFVICYRESMLTVQPA